MNYILFILTFMYLSNWFQINTFLSLIIGPKVKSYSIDDKWIKSIVKKKTGLNLTDITIFDDQKLYGMMPGLPFWQWLQSVLKIPFQNRHHCLKP